MKRKCSNEECSQDTKKIKLSQKEIREKIEKLNTQRCIIDDKIRFLKNELTQSIFVFDSVIFENIVSYLNYKDIQLIKRLFRKNEDFSTILIRRENDCILKIIDNLPIICKKDANLYQEFMDIDDNYQLACMHFKIVPKIEKTTHNKPKEFTCYCGNPRLKYYLSVDTFLFKPLEYFDTTQIDSKKDVDCFKFNIEMLRKNTDILRQLKKNYSNCFKYKSKDSSNEKIKTIFNYYLMKYRLFDFCSLIPTKIHDIKPAKKELRGKYDIIEGREVHDLYLKHIHSEMSKKKKMEIILYIN